MKAVTKYPGAKWKLAEQIISLFPHHHTYLEPFFGSGAVLFSKQRSDIETVNDIDGEVVNLFDCILKDPEKLARIIYFTPYARDVYEKTYTSSTNDKFQRAVNFYIQLNMGHGFRTTGEKVGWKEDIYAAAKEPMLQCSGAACRTGLLMLPKDCAVYKLKIVRLRT